MRTINCSSPTVAITSRPTQQTATRSKLNFPHSVKVAHLDGKLVELATLTDYYMAVFVYVCLDVLACAHDISFKHLKLRHFDVMVITFFVDSFMA